MDDATVSAAALARSMRISYQAIKQVLNGKSKAFSAANNARAAAALGVDAGWLATGQGTMMLTFPPKEAARDIISATASATTVQQVRYLPVLSLAQVLENTRAVPSSPTIPFEPVRETASGQAFFLVITGDGMKPELRDSDRLLVEPCVSPEPGDCVVAIDAAHKKAYLSKYRLRGISQEGQEIFDLVPLNDYYPTIRSEEQRLTIVGTVVELRRQFRKI